MFPSRGSRSSRTSQGPVLQIPDLPRGPDGQRAPGRHLAAAAQLLRNRQAAQDPGGREPHPVRHQEVRRPGGVPETSRRRPGAGRTVTNPPSVCRPELLTEQVKQETPSNSVCDSGLLPVSFKLKPTRAGLTFTNGCPEELDSKDTAPVTEDGAALSKRPGFSGEAPLPVSPAAGGPSGSCQLQVQPSRSLTRTCPVSRVSGVQAVQDRLGQHAAGASPGSLQQEVRRGVGHQVPSPSALQEDQEQPRLGHH